MARQLTEEHKRAISEAGKGRVVSAETRRKQSEALRGRKRPVEVVEKVRQAVRGRRASDATKLKMSRAHQGVKKSATHAANISAGLKLAYANNPDRAQAVSKRLTGVPLTDSHKRKLSEAQLRRFSDSDELERMTPKWLRNLSSGVYISIKAGEIYYRSNYELDYFKSLDTDDTVHTYEVEPYELRVSYEFEGRLHNYIPDVRIKYLDGSWIVVEVKPAYMLNDPVNIAKFDAAWAIFGPRYKIITETEIYIK